MISSRNIIFNVVNKVINQNLYNSLPELIDVLNKNKSCFLKLLENDPLNSIDRNMILNSSKDPIKMTGIPQKITLSEEFIHESLIISDMFKLNEITSTELLMTGEAESTANPDMTRGLIAILNYYYSQKTIVECLRLLLQARLVITEDSPAAAEVLTFIDIYLNNLFQNGLFSRIILLVKSMNIDKEVELLESQMALGSPRHRRQFYVIYDLIKKILCDCIMLRSYETPLNKKETNELICLLRELYQDDIHVKKEDGITESFKPKNNVDHCFIYLLISLLNSTNPILEGNSVENISNKCLSHPFFVEDDYQKGIDKILRDNFENSLVVKTSQYDAKNIVQGIDQMLYLSWIITLQKVSHLKKETSINVRYQRSMNFGDYDDFVDLEVLPIDCQHVYDCFQFLIQLINIESFHEENIWIKSIHNFVTDFIVFMPKMIKDLRIESMRSHSNVHYFSSLLDLIGSLYGGPKKMCEDLEPQLNPLLESLVLEYWSPNEIVNYSDSITLFAFEENFKNWKVKSNDSYKQSVLFKFIRDSGDLIENSQLFISYVFMLKGLCCSDRTSLCIYSLLNNNLMSNSTSKLTWEWFSNSLHNHAKFLMATSHKLHTMSQSELQGLLEVLQLIKRVTQHSKVVCTSMISNESLMLAQNIIMLLSCRVPEILKAELLNCLAVFCIGNGLVAKSIWQSLEYNNILARPSNPMNSSILIELDQIEPKSQEFFITRAFIKLLLAEVPHIISNISVIVDQPTNFLDQSNQTVITASNQYQSLDNFTNVINMVMDTVFLKHSMRTYKNIEEKYAVSESFLELCCKCVDIFLAKAGNVKITKGKLAWCQYDPGYFVISQLLNDSPFLKILISVIDNGFSQINDGLNNLTFGSKTLSKDAMKSLQNSIYYAMHLIWMVLNKESFLIHLVRDLINSKTKTENSQFTTRGPRFRNFIPQELSRLLMSSGSVHHFLPNLMKYVGIVDETERLSRKALAIVYSCINIIEPHNNLKLMLTNKNMIDIDILPLLVNCIDKFDDVDQFSFDYIEDRGLSTLFVNNPSLDSPRTLVLKMLISSLEKPAPNLGHHLMGFNCESIAALRRTSLQEAGVGDCPKSCFHSLLNLIHRLSAEIITNPCFDNPDTSGDQLTTLTINMMDLTFAFKILHLLASDSNTSLFVLRFIRSNYQLIIKQMDLLSFNTNKVAAVPELRALFWNQKSWLLKIIAIELRQCTANQQRSYVSQLLKLLFGDDLFEVTNDTVFSKFYNEEQGCRGLIYELLEDMDISEPEQLVDFSGSQRFKPQILKEYLSQCFEDSYMGLRLMNSDRVKQLIYADVSVCVEEEQSLSLQREVDSVCTGIARYNINEIWLVLGKASVVDGWCQVVEVVIATDCSGEDSVTVPVKTRKICDTLTMVMDRILVPTIPSAMVVPLSGACLILTAVLGGMFVTGSSNEVSTISGHLMPGDSVVDCLDEHKLSAINTPDMDGQLRRLVQLTTDCILKINSSHQNTRIKFYGVLTYLIQIVLKLDSYRPQHSHNSLIQDCYLIINNTSSSPSSSLMHDSLRERCLYPVMCRDAVSGNVHLSLSSLTVLDSIASVDGGHGGLISYFVSNGYLQNLIDSLEKDCANMSHLIQDHGDRSSSTTSTIPYYLYQSKMSLLCKWATQAAGSRALVQYGLLTSLSRCDLFCGRLRPVTVTEHCEQDDNGDNPANQYSTVLSLAVTLATTILWSQGPDKTDTVRELVTFAGQLSQALCTPFQHSATADSGAATKDMLIISDLFVALSSLTDVPEAHIATMDRIKTACGQMLACLVGLVHERPLTPSHTMHQLLQIQLMGNLLAVVSGMVSSCSNESHKLLFFSSNVDDILGFRTNWTNTVKMMCQKMMCGEKPPLTMIVMVLHQLQECYSDIRQRIGRFVMSDCDLSSTTVKDPAEVARDLETMSGDQLRVLWTSVMEGAGVMMGSAAMDCYDDYGGDHNNVTMINRPKNDLVRDLLVVYRRLCHIVSDSLTGSLECCCYLLWHHVHCYQTLVADIDDRPITNMHPIQRLQLLGRDQRLSATSKSGPDLVSVVAQCVDDLFLTKVHQCLEVSDADGHGDRASFARIVTHRLARILKLASS